jgi:hypothetical protein
MPFGQLIPRPFHPSAMRTYAPVASGVYGISNAHEWVFIGESDDIQGSLSAHAQEMGTALMQRQPTRFVFEICDQLKRSTRQDRLIQEYEPRCNRHMSRYPGAKPKVSTK